MTVKYFEVESGNSAEVLINQFSKENNVFATQIMPLTQEGTTIGFGVFIHMREDYSQGLSTRGESESISPLPDTSDLITNYDKAKEDKFNNKNSPASEKQLWALDQANYKWNIPRDKITKLQAIQLLKDLGYKGVKREN